MSVWELFRELRVTYGGFFWLALAKKFHRHVDVALYYLITLKEDEAMQLLTELQEELQARKVSE